MYSSFLEIRDTRMHTSPYSLARVRSRAASRARARAQSVWLSSRQFDRSVMSRPREMYDHRKTQALAPRAVQLPSVSRGRDVAFPNTDARAERYEMRTFSRTTVLSGPSSHQGSGTLSGLRAETGAHFSSRRGKRASRKIASVGHRLTKTLVFFARIGRIASEYIAVKSTNEDLRRANEEHQEEIKRLEKERGAALAQCAALKATLETDRQQRREVLAKQQEMEDTIDEIRSQQIRSAELLEEAKGNYDVSSKIVSDRLADDEQIVARLKTLSEELLLSKEEVDGLKAHKRKASVDMGELQIKLDDVSEKLTAVEEENKSKSVALDKLNSELEKSKQSSFRKDEMLKEMRDEHKSLETNLRALYEDRLRISNARLEEEIATNASAQEAIQKLEEKNDATESELASLNEEFGAQFKELHTLRSAVPALKSDCDELRKQCDDGVSKLLEMKNENNELAQALQLKKAELKVTETRVQETETQNHQLSREVQDLSTQIETLQSKLNEELERVLKSKSHEAALSAKIDEQVAALTKRNKEWMMQKDREHEEVMREKDEQIESLNQTLENALEDLRNAQEVRKYTEQQLADLKRVRRGEEFSAHARKRPLETSIVKIVPEVAVPTPRPGATKRRARSRPRRTERELPPETHVSPSPEERAAVASSSKKKSRPKKKSKKELKNEVRAFASTALEEDDAFDPFAFAETP